MRVRVRLRRVYRVRARLRLRLRIWFVRRVHCCQCLQLRLRLSMGCSLTCSSARFNSQYLCVSIQGFVLLPFTYSFNVFVSVVCCVYVSVYVRLYFLTPRVGSPSPRRSKPKVCNCTLARCSFTLARCSRALARHSYATSLEETARHRRRQT